jgi:hypothetical protein
VNLFTGLKTEAYDTIKGSRIPEVGYLYLLKRKEMKPQGIWTVTVSSELQNRLQNVSLLG